MDIVKLFYPKVNIAGLAISDSSARILLLGKKNSSIYVITQAGVRLGQDILENGKVKDKEGLIASLKELKTKAGRRLDAFQNVIVSLPPNDIYSQFFKFPNLSSDQIKEAMELNISTALPFPSGDVYVDWQEQGEFKIELVSYKEVMLEAIKKDKTDAYIDCLEKAGLVSLAFESPTQSLVRLAANFKKESGLLVYLNEEGVNLIVVQDNFARFEHFVPWFGRMEEQRRTALTPEFMIDFLIKQIKLAVNFYQTKNGDNILEKLVLLAPSAVKDIVAVGLEGKVDLKFEPFEIIATGFEKKNNGLPVLDDSWLITSGAAIRGLIPRSEDFINSLMPVGTEAVYANRKFVSYVTLWSDIVSALSVGIITLFLGLYFFLGYSLNGLNGQLSARGVVSAPLTIGDLEQKAFDLNQKIEVMVPAAEKANTISHAIEKILAQAPPGINFTNLSFISPEQPINLTGVASGRDAILLFKNKLENSPDFFDVNLPLGSLVQTQNILFTISFKLKQ